MPNSPQTPAVSFTRRIAFLPPRVFGGFALALAAVLTLAFLSYDSLVTRSLTVAKVGRASAFVADLQTTLSMAKDLEVGYRGFLLTGEESYLQPYLVAKQALPAHMAQLRADVRDNAPLSLSVITITNTMNEASLGYARSIARHRISDPGPQVALQEAARSKLVMDELRAIVARTTEAGRAALVQDEAAWESAARASFYVQVGGAIVLILLILGAAGIASRDHRHREVLAWLRTGQVALAKRLQGDMRPESLGETVLEFLAGFMGAQRGAVYVLESNRLQRIAAHAADEAPSSMEIGEGLLGQAVNSSGPVRVTDVPQGYFDVQSSLGKSRASELLITPARVGSRTLAVIELGFFRKLEPQDLEFLERVSEQLGIAVRSAQDRGRLEMLLEETQRQSEELQTQQEELRVTNEELEEQGRLLRQSQVLLEAQQSDLEQSNVQLEEQTQQLESQRDQLTQAGHALEERAAELQRANHYKNEFLANMSHELRTPLNSSLILSKLLAENAGGNLTAEQVHFAETIGDAGNDLLALINDILDLSKIEAGKVDVDREAVDVRALVESIQATFMPVAQIKKLSLVVGMDPGCPVTIVSDRQRVAQILKNLLSNALKFTESGEVSLRVGCHDGRITFAVRDTGIGLPQDQHDIIFEAFRQADGSTHRKYGGTGLGLSISRDLARLLGGDISLDSRPGEGSLFTLDLPITGVEGITQESLRKRPPVTEATPAPLQARPRPPVAPRRDTPVSDPLMDDDRYELTGGRTLLLIEDDLEFAGILRDLARQKGFQCVIAHTAEAGLAAASRYTPKAILLDMKLPDLSGLAVLDQLKRDPATRHVPVHVVSGSDLAHEARELGAVGYALKPVTREQIASALDALEAKFTQLTRRVLIVEDDARQRESVVALLAGENTELVAVSTASQALEALSRTTFDCIVMDLNLPDLTGYELLEQMSKREDVPFPPVIVYTGRSLSRDEEQGLRRFSRSIIIKGARSPERLLDEVTLFLHQVESSLSAERQGMLKAVRNRDAALEGRRVLVVEDDVRNVFALTSVLEPKGAKVSIARNGREALEVLQRETGKDAAGIDLILMDIMMPEMDGFTAMREIRKQPAWARIPIIALTAKAMKDDHEQCLAAGANDYISKPLDVERLLSLVRVWMPK